MNFVFQSEAVFFTIYAPYYYVIVCNNNLPHNESCTLHNRGGHCSYGRDSTFMTRGRSSSREYSTFITRGLCSYGDSQPAWSCHLPRNWMHTLNHVYAMQMQVSLFSLRYCHLWHRLVSKVVIIYKATKCHMQKTTTEIFTAVKSSDYLLWSASCVNVS